jgi:hypothetical protein
VLILKKYVCFVVNIVFVMIICVYCIKIKYVNFGNISDICDKLNFIINYIYLPQLTHILSKNKHITIFDTCDRTVP